MKRVTLTLIGVVVVSISASACFSSSKHRAHHKTIQEKATVMEQRANAMITLIESDSSLPEIDTSYDDNAGVSWEQHVFQGKNITVVKTRILDKKNNLRLQLDSHKNAEELRHVMNVMN